MDNLDKARHFALSGQSLNSKYPILISLISIVDGRREEWDKRYQQELRELEQSLEASGVDIIWPRGASVQGVLSNEFAVKLVTMVGPALGAAVGAWLHARYGRKVRLKIGDIEAQT